MVFRKYQNVLVEEPHIGSQAALVMLIQFYAQRDIVAMGKTSKVWQKVRRRYIEEYKETHDEFRCFNCNKQLFEDEKPNSFKRVTVDHILELKFGGSMTDFNNMRIACNKCNSTRSNYGDS